jgi:hypothetical protein
MREKEKRISCAIFFSFHSFEKASTVTHQSIIYWLTKMIRSFFFLILVVIIIDVACTIPIGYIYNATYVSNDTTIVITYQNACSECICNGFFSSIPPLYVGLNCYQNNKTCQLFANYSTSSMMVWNPNSTFIFIQQPPMQNTTTSNYTFLTVSRVIKYPYVMLISLSTIPTELNCKS